MRPNEAAAITILLGGQTPTYPPEAYRLGPNIDKDGMVEFRPEPLSLDPGDVHFIGAALMRRTDSIGVRGTR